MNEPPVSVDLFAEDFAHESFMKALMSRVAREEAVAIDVRVACARGGRGRALAELQGYLRTRSAAPDLLVVVVDTNCGRWTSVRGGITEAIDRTRFGPLVVACPDPHVERWFMADPVALEQALDTRVTPGRRKCERGRYKRLLIAALRAAGHDVTLGGAEFAEEIVEAMDLYRAGKAETSLRHTVEGLRDAFREASAAAGCRMGT